MDLNVMARVPPIGRAIYLSSIGTGSNSQGYPIQYGLQRPNGSSEYIHFTFIHRHAPIDMGRRV